MNKDNLSVRFARLEDAKALLEIYRPFVESEDDNLSDVSFEYVAPSEEEFRERIKNISAQFPYLVLEQDGEPIGYAYAHPYIQREAYQWSVEETIYLGPKGQSRGYGKLILGVLDKLLVLQGVTNAYACIAAKNAHSVGLATSLGYRLVGTYKDCAFKNGHWLDMVWLEKVLQEHKAKAELIKSIHDLDKEVVAKILQEL